MKHTPTYTVIVAVTLLLCSCHRNTFTLEGTLENGAGKTIYISELTPRDGEKETATLTLDKRGHFKMKEKIDYLTFYNLHVNQTDYVVLLPQQGEHLVLKGNYNDLTHSYEVSGSPQSTLLWQLQDYSNQGAQSISDLVAQDRENKASLSPDAYEAAKLTTDSIFLAIRNQQAKYMEDFIYDNQGSLTTLIALYKPFNGHPILPPQQYYELYSVVLQGLTEQLPDNPHTVNFKNTASKIEYQYGNQ